MEHWQKFEKNYEKFVFHLRVLGYFRWLPFPKKFLNFSNLRLDDQYLWNFEHIHLTKTVMNDKKMFKSTIFVSLWNHRQNIGVGGYFQATIFTPKRKNNLLNILDKIDLWKHAFGDIWDYDSLEKVVSTFDIVGIKRKLSVEESLKLK